MSMKYEAILKAHDNWVTALACPQGISDIKVVSASRDKTLLTWKAGGGPRATEPQRRLVGHSNFVNDVALSTDGKYAVSAAWDRSLRLWDVKTGETKQKFFGHKGDVLTVALAPNNRQIVSGGRDNKIKVWNVKGECIHTLDNGAHIDWVSCVRFSPVVSDVNQIVSGSWDGTVKVWDLTTSTCLQTLKAHTGQINCVTVSPDSSLFASASKDGITKLWDMRRCEHLYQLSGDQPINQICFSPNRYWLCAATKSSVRIYDLESKDVLAELDTEKDGKKVPECISIAWSADGTYLYSGYTDSCIRVWSVVADSS